MTTIFSPGRKAYYDGIYLGWLGRPCLGNSLHADCISTYLRTIIPLRLTASRRYDSGFVAPVLRHTLRLGKGRRAATVIR